MQFIEFYFRMTQISKTMLHKQTGKTNPIFDSTNYDSKINVVTIVSFKSNKHERTPETYF